MDLADHVRPRQDQQVVVALEIVPMIPESLAAEIRFRQPIPLDHRPHRAIEEEDACGEKRMQAFGGGLGGGHSLVSSI